jgi:1-deoxy-D-xylulose-5-phosphate reductoisomerase
MINKGFELIEAHFLFNVDHSQLDVLIHPQSIIHSLVTFVDGSVIAQASLPDMRIPISFAIAYPERLTNKMPFLNLADYNNIEFMKPDYEKFTLLKLSMEILKSNCNSYNIGLEAANAVAVESFLKGTINFLDIYIIIKKIVDYIEPINILAINNILQFREEIVIKTRELIKKLR